MAILTWHFGTWSNVTGRVFNTVAAAWRGVVDRHIIHKLTSLYLLKDLLGRYGTEIVTCMGYGFVDYTTNPKVRNASWLSSVSLPPELPSDLQKAFRWSPCTIAYA
jgi:hypothetical protein